MNSKSLADDAAHPTFGYHLNIIDTGLNRILIVLAHT